MNVGAIVKVMNFHALLRVDAARKRADNYLALEEELSAMIDIIINNRNFRLDKRILRPSKDKPILNIYIGSDYGFCGGINSAINTRIAKDEEKNIKVSIGKRLRQTKAVNLRMHYEEFDERFEEIEALLYDAVHDLKYQKVNLVYNHYYNMSTIAPVEKTIYPMEPKEDNTQGYTGDFAIEGDVDELLEKMVMSYLGYEVKIAHANAFAAENIIRQNATSQSLKKIEEVEQEKVMEQRRVRSLKAFGKVVESFMKKKMMGGELG